MAFSKLIFNAEERGARTGEKAAAPMKEAMMARARNIFVLRVSSEIKL
jgi:hypothetical protein